MGINDQSIPLFFFFYSGSAVGGTNIQGEDQKKLDVIANDLFINMLSSSFEVLKKLNDIICYNCYKQ